VEFYQALTRAWGVAQSYFPGVDLQRLVATNPKPLLKSKVALEEDLLNVRSMLAEAVNPDALVATLPILLEPKVLVSCLVTIQRWFPKKDPLEVRHPRVGLSSVSCRTSRTLVLRPSYPLLHLLLPPLALPPQGIQAWRAGLRPAQPCPCRVAPPAAAAQLHLDPD
jgi:hypothetical protein